jgi:IS30 family transposase
MPKSTNSYQHLKPEDRMTIASLMQQNFSQRDIAQLIGCSASTISRELVRNTQGKTHDSQSAQRACQQRRIDSRPQRKLHTQSILFGVVHTLMSSRWSPEQIALSLGQIYPKGHELRVSHETIYNCIYAQPVSELRKALIACLRQANNKRTPRSKGQDRRGQIPDMLSIHMRPPRSRTGSFPDSGRVTRSKARPTPVQWAPWWSAPADC